MTYDKKDRIYRDDTGNTWKAIKNRHTGMVTGYVEVFKSRALGYVSVPGASRFMNA